MARIKYSLARHFKGQLPLRSNIDPLDPRQALLPAFVGFLPTGAPLISQIEYYEELSEHLVEYLGVPVRIEKGRKRLLAPLGDGLGWEPRRKYRPPTTLLDKGTAAGFWVSVDEPDPDVESVTQTLNKMSGPSLTGVPEMVLVKDFRRALGVSHAQCKLLLEGWGVPNVKPGTAIDKGLAARIVAHLNRARAAG